MILVLQPCSFVSLHFSRPVCICREVFSRSADEEISAVLFLSFREAPPRFLTACTKAIMREGLNGHQTHPLAFADLLFPHAHSFPSASWPEGQMLGQMEKWADDLSGDFSDIFTHSFLLLSFLSNLSLILHGKSSRLPDRSIVLFSHRSAFLAFSCMDVCTVMMKS